MPLPMEFQHASDDFERFLGEARDRADLATRNQAWTMVEGVFRVFRRRLSVAEGLRFADALPPLLRALFVTEWDIDTPPVPFASREAMTREVQSLRPHHNFSPDTSIGDVAIALRRAVAVGAFDRVLADLPEGAVAFWKA